MVKTARQRQAEYAARYPDRVKASQKAWKQKNAERVAAYDVAYKRQNQQRQRQERKARDWRKMVGVWRTEE